MCFFMFFFAFARVFTSKRCRLEDPRALQGLQGLLQQQMLVPGMPQMMPMGLARPMLPPQVGPNCFRVLQDRYCVKIYMIFIYTIR